MATEGLPVERHLDLLLELARVAPSMEAYEPIARAHGLEVRAPGLLRKPGFGLMVVDGRLAPLHAMGLFEDGEPEPAEPLGVAVTSDCDELARAFHRLRHELARRLGPPRDEGSWRSICLLHDEAHAYHFAAWAFDESILVLLLDEEGDGHIGELAALDLRIAPRVAERDLPESVRGPFGWPVDP